MTKQGSATGLENKIKDEKSHFHRVECRWNLIETSNYTRCLEKSKSWRSRLEEGSLEKSQEEELGIGVISTT